MSSTGYYAKVLSVCGKEVVLEVRAGTAGGLSDHVITRSFVLFLLGDLGRIDGDANNESWVRDNCARYVESVTIESIVGFTNDDRIRNSAANYEVDVEWLKPRVTMRARFTSDALASAFVVDAELETTGYDVWWNDPQRPKTPDAKWPKNPEPIVADALQRMWSRIERDLGPWKIHAQGSATLETGAMQWQLELYQQRDFSLVPEEFVLQSSGHVPSFESRRALVKKKAPTPMGVLFAYPTNRLWRRRERGVRESPESLGDRARETILAMTPMIEALSKKDVLLSLIEDRCEDMREKGFARIAPKIEPPIAPEGVAYSAHNTSFFLRAAIFRALADEEAAKAAFAQTARWKRVPKEYAGVLQ